MENEKNEQERHIRELQEQVKESNKKMASLKRSHQAEKKKTAQMLEEVMWYCHVNIPEFLAFVPVQNFLSIHDLSSVSKSWTECLISNSFTSYFTTQARKREGELDEGKSTLVSELTIKVRILVLE